MSTTAPQRLPAAERRQAILEARASACSRTRATTARRRPRSRARPASASRSSIATSPRSGSSTSRASRRAGAASGRRSRTRLAAEPDPSRWPVDDPARRALLPRARRDAKPSSLWVQAINQASEDPEIRKAIRKNLREVHGSSEEVIREAQARGGVPGRPRPECGGVDLARRRAPPLDLEPGRRATDARRLRCHRKREKRLVERKKRPKKGKPPGLAAPRGFSFVCA
jgi:hypothetical protein